MNGQELKRLGRDVKKLCQIMTDIFNMRAGQVKKEQRTKRSASDDEHSIDEKIFLVLGTKRKT